MPNSGLSASGVRPRQPLMHSVLPGSSAAVRVRPRRARGHALEPGAVRPGRPLRVRSVGDVHEVLDQLAVADVDRLRDHVGVRVLRDRGVDDHAGMALRVDVLLDRAARAADADRVGRDAVALDEALLRHDRRLRAEHEVVVRARARPARVDDRVALREADVVEAAASAGRSLDVADRHAAVEGVDQAAVPERRVRRRRGVAGRREDRDRVDEAVDRAALAANHVRHGASVERGRRRGVRRERSGRQRDERAAGRAVDEVDDAVDRAVLAPADRGRRLRSPASGRAACRRRPGCRRAGSRARPSGSCRRTDTAAGRRRSAP